MNEIEQLDLAHFEPGGIGEEEWTPQYSYWKRPAKLDDGGLKISE